MPKMDFQRRFYMARIIWILDWFSFKYNWTCFTVETFWWLFRHFFSKILPNFVDSALGLFTKYYNFFGVCWFLAKNLAGRRKIGPKGFWKISSSWINSIVNWILFRNGICIWSRSYGSNSRTDNSDSLYNDKYNGLDDPCDCWSILRYEKRRNGYHSTLLSWVVNGWWHRFGLCLFWFLLIQRSAAQ